MTDLDQSVRLYIYDHFVRFQRAPTSNEISAALGQSRSEVVTSLQSLASARTLVLQAEGTAVLMAEPFSAIPTGFEVRVGKRSWWANCAWDALGIPAALHEDAEIFASCADCDAPLKLEVVDGSVGGDSGLIHLAVPAAQWWDDIVFT
jgi:hypothetical protein